MRRFNKYILFSLVVLSTIIVFRPLFSLNTIAKGDAPHFIDKEFTELISEPSSWTARGENFGGVDPRIWISPILIVYGSLGKFGFTNESIVRLLFYFPSLVLSFWGIYLVSKKEKIGWIGRVIASVFYVFNTYYLLLVDGGQVGIVLAYGVFPFSYLLFLNFLEKATLFSFTSALAVVYLNMIADPRVGILSFVCAFLYFFTKRLLNKDGSENISFKHILIFVLCLFLLNLYWIYPLIKISQTSGSFQISGLELSSLLHGIFVYQPHWPGNIFGKVVTPPWYFVGIPLIVFTAFFKAKQKSVRVFTLLFLLFAFLSKGTTYPFGFLYEWGLAHIPLASAFRDSSKFFIPLIFVTSILIGKFIEANKKTYISYAIFVYIMFLVAPAFTNNLNFVLSGKDVNKDVFEINKKIEETSGFYRIAWFPEKSSLAYEGQDRPSLDAKSLSDTRVFGKMNTGSHDKFNFLHNEDYITWFRLLGIKYLIFSGDNRNPNPTNEELKNWNDFNTLVATSSALVKNDWNLNMPVYEVEDTRDHLFEVDKMIAVVGPEPYESLDSDAISNNLFLFFEDGKLDPLALEGLDEDAGTIVFNGKSEDDLTMSFLQKYFLSTFETKQNNWAKYSVGEYLTWKYQLLIRDVDVKDFDYGKGISLSTNPGEDIEWNINVDETSDYVLAIRHLGNSDSKFSFKIGSEKGEIGNNSTNTFNWFTKGIKLNKGENNLTLTSSSGLNVVNTVAIVPVPDWNIAKNHTQVFLTYFGTTSLSDLNKVTSESKYRNITYSKVNSTWYDVTPDESGNWIVFTDTYHPDWKLKKGVEYLNSVPAYSMVNAFYVEPNWSNTSIIFEGQSSVRWGIYYSVTSLLGISLYFFWNSPDRKK